MVSAPSGTVTFLFTDIEGSTRRWERDGAAMARALEVHDAVVRDGVVGYRGHIFKTVGDSFCCAFANVDDAARAALSVQRGLGTIDFAAVDDIRVRIAIHTGSATERDDDYFGPTVNRVARLLAVGHGGQILVSGTSAALLTENPVEDVRLVDLGFHHLKDLGRAEHVYQIETGNRRAFPPLRSLSSVPHNLPAFASTFVGREAEVSEIGGRLGSTRGLTIFGAGGIGKTRCALAVAEMELRTSHQGVWLVEFASLTDGKYVASTIAATLGVAVLQDGDALDAVCEEIRAKSVLLVLDNCEHVVDDAARCAESLLARCAHLRIIATSREALGYRGEIVYRLPSLSTPAGDDELTVDRALTYDAVNLFAKRAAESGAGFQLTHENVALVASICRQLDGIALAVELAAMRLRSLSLTQVAEGLKTRFRLLTGGSRTALPRQRTMRALIDWSYDLLTPDEQRLFRALAVFSGPFTVAACEGLCEGDLQEVDHLEILSSLVDKSLVERTVAASNDYAAEPDLRYRIVDCLREYALERLRETNELSDRIASLARWALDVVERAETSWATTPSEIWESTFRPELEGLRSAVDWSTSTDGDIDAGRRIVARGRRLFGVIAPGEGLRLLKAMPPPAADAQKPDAELLLAEAQMNIALRRYAPALARANDALAVIDRAGQTHLHHEAQIVAGYSHALLGRFSEARRLLEEALAFFERAGVTQWCGVIHSDLGVTCDLMSDDDGARESFLAALRCFEATRNARGIRVLTINLAELDFRRGDVDVAIASIESAVRASGGSDALVLSNYAAYLLFKKRFVEALEFARESLLVSTASDHERNAFLGLQHVAAALAFANDDPADAQRLETATRLIGYVDRHFEATFGSREFTEREEHARVLECLRKAIKPSILNTLLAEGAALDHQQALEMALRA